MLVLSRHEGERIMIGDDVTILVVELGKGRVRLGIDAPKGKPILREELYYVVKRDGCHHKGQGTCERCGAPMEGAHGS